VPLALQLNLAAL